MEEIKLRAWDKVNKIFKYSNEKMLVIPPFWETSDYSIVYRQPNSDHYIHGFSGVLMRYIGRKDKNDVEIYAGDIVRLDNEEMNKIHTNWCGNPIIEVKIEINRFQCSWEFFSKFGEVIGNIYENPELLN